MDGSQEILKFSIAIHNYRLFHTFSTFNLCSAICLWSAEIPKDIKRFINVTNTEVNKYVSVSPSGIYQMSLNNNKANHYNKHLK